MFGKFDAFCARLDGVVTLVNGIYNYSALANVRLEGLDPIVNKFKTVADAMRRKAYDFLDVRKTEFDVDYAEFQRQIDTINAQLQRYVDAWFEKPLSVGKFMHLLSKFEQLEGIELDLQEKYQRVLAQFARDLENVKKIYQKNRLQPPSSRNLPPISSRIAWARQLYLSIEGPMKLLKEKDDLMQTPEGKKVVVNYNKVAAVLTQYELLYHQSWCDAIEAATIGLGATVLVQHPQTAQIFVNFDPKLLELFEETRFLMKMGLQIPHNAEALQKKATQFKQCKMELEEILKRFEAIKARIPPILGPVVKVIRSRFEKILQPGLLTVTWRSVSIDGFLKSCHQGLKEFNTLVAQIDDTMAFQIEARLKEISETPLLELPTDEPVSLTEFLETTEERAHELAHDINSITRQVEASVVELVTLLRSMQKESKEEKETIERLGSETERSEKSQAIPGVSGYFLCRQVAK